MMTVRIPRPTIISREEWGADDPMNCQGTNNPIQIVVHHSGDKNDAWSNLYGSDEYGFQKAIQEYHMGEGIVILGIIMALASWVPLWTVAMMP